MRGVLDLGRGPIPPRGAGWKRGRRPGRRSPWDSNLLRGAVAFVSVVLLALVATRTIGGRLRSDQEKVLAELLASADRAEASSRYDVALRELEAAFVPATVTATGLALWRYLGGPWQPLGDYRFSPAPTG